MFGVLTVLRRYAAGVPPTVVETYGMRALLFLTCPTVGPMARRARWDIPGNSLGQWLTSTSTRELMFGVLTVL